MMISTKGNGRIRMGIAAAVASAGITAAAIDNKPELSCKPISQETYKKLPLKNEIKQLVRNVTEETTNRYADKSERTRGYNTILRTHDNGGLVNIKYTVVDKVGGRLEICLSDSANYFKAGQPLYVSNMGPVNPGKEDCFGANLRMDGSLMNSPQMSDRDKTELSDVVKMTNAIFNDKAYDKVLNR